MRLSEEYWTKETKKIFKFEDTSMLEDIKDSKGKVIRYRTVFVIKDTEDNAREDAKLDAGYSLISAYVLPEWW